MLKVGDRVRIHPDFIELLKGYNQSIDQSEDHIFTIQQLGISPLGDGTLPPTQWVEVDRSFWEQSRRLSGFHAKVNGGDDKYHGPNNEYEVFIKVGDDSNPNNSLPLGIRTKITALFED